MSFPACQAELARYMGDRSKIETHLIVLSSPGGRIGARVALVRHDVPAPTAEGVGLTFVRVRLQARGAQFVIPAVGDSIRVGSSIWEVPPGTTFYKNLTPLGAPVPGTGAPGPGYPAPLSPGDHTKDVWVFFSHRQNDFALEREDPVDVLQLEAELLPGTTPRSISAYAVAVPDLPARTASALHLIP